MIRLHTISTLFPYTTLFQSGRLGPAASAALSSPIPTGRIPLTVFAAPYKGTAPNASVALALEMRVNDLDRKSTRLNSSHGYISYAVFHLKKKTRYSLLQPNL